MQPHPDPAMVSTPQAPVHARMQHGEHSLPSFQEMAAGLTGGRDFQLHSHPACNGKVLVSITLCALGLQCKGECRTGIVLPQDMGQISGLLPALA